MNLSISNEGISLTILKLYGSIGSMGIYPLYRQSTVFDVENTE